MAEIKLESTKRLKSGKGSSKRMRKTGLIPAVVYGKNVENKHIAISQKDIRKILRNPEIRNNLIDLIIEEENEPWKVIIKSITSDSISDELLHIDFHKVSLTEKITITVPIKILNEAKGVKEGGILEHTLREVDIITLPGNIPPYIEVDVTDLEIGEAIHLKDLTLPENIEIDDDLNKTILSITAPSLEEAAEEAVAEEGAEVTAEGKEAEPEKKDAPAKE